MLNIVLFGPPGAGKGTQSERLIEKYDLVHLSTGDIFRANIKMQSELGVLAKSYMDQGLLVPDSVTIEMLRSELTKKQEVSGFIFDGFPRTNAQAAALDEVLLTFKTSITKMAALEVEEEELKRRLLNRATTSGRAERFRISGETGNITAQGGVIAASANVSGISTLGTVQISSGIVTATSGIEYLVIARVSNDSRCTFAGAFASRLLGRRIQFWVGPT